MRDQSEDKSSADKSSDGRLSAFVQLWCFAKQLYARLYNLGPAIGVIHMLKRTIAVAIHDLRCLTPPVAALGGQPTSHCALQLWRNEMVSVKYYSTSNYCLADLFVAGKC